MVAVDPFGAVRLAIAAGATSPNPSTVGGFIAWSTTLNAPVVWNGTAWQILAYGHTVSLTGVAADASAATTVTFPFTFASTPKVVATVVNDPTVTPAILVVAVANKSTTACNVWVLGGAAGSTCGVDLIATL